MVPRLLFMLLLMRLGCAKQCLELITSKHCLSHSLISSGSQSSCSQAPRSHLRTQCGPYCMPPRGFQGSRSETPSCSKRNRGGVWVHHSELICCVCCVLVCQVCVLPCLICVLIGGELRNVAEVVAFHFVIEERKSHRHPHLLFREVRVLPLRCNVVTVKAVDANL